jgi:hypothetical protein
MIIHCKGVGVASTRPCGDRVYFLSQYLLRVAGDPPGYDLVKVVPDPKGTGLMRSIQSEELVVPSEQVYCYPEKVQIHDHALLVRLAAESGYRCTVFTGLDEHLTFVLDPDPDELLTIHVYDIIPPRPSLSACIKELEACGLFGDLSVRFVHHIEDISTWDADVFPCRAAGFHRTLDADRMVGGEKVAGCITGATLYHECCDQEMTQLNTCPVDQVSEEPFIARCCRIERTGIAIHHGRFGAVVHWGASPADIAHSIQALVKEWRDRG